MAHEQSMTSYSQQYLQQVEHCYRETEKNEGTVSARYQLAVQAVALSALNALDALQELSTPLFVLSPLLTLRLNRKARSIAWLALSILSIPPAQGYAPLLKAYGRCIADSPRALVKAAAHIGLMILTVPMACMTDARRLTQLYANVGLHTDSSHTDRPVPGRVSEHQGFKGVIGQEKAKQTLEDQVILPAQYAANPKHTALQALQSQRGVVLFGPPGCGKTHLAKALANELGATLQEIRIATVGSKYVNQTSNNIHSQFEQARRRGGRTLLLLDEADSLLAFRSHNEQRLHAAEVTNTLLQEMDAIHADKSCEVWVVACTNYAYLLDPAAVRNGRFSVSIPITTPTKQERIAQLQHFTRGLDGLSEENIKKLATLSDGFTVSDLEALVRSVANRACVHLLRKMQGSTATEEELRSKLKVTLEQFQEALKSLRPSLNSEARRLYAQDQAQFFGQNVWH